MRTETMWTTVIETPVGSLTGLASSEGLRALLWPEQSVARFASHPLTARPTEQPVLAKLAIQLREYFAGSRRSFDLPLDPIGTEFQKAAWTALRAIPYGATRTYTQQAVAVGRPKAVRAIGAANGRNPLSIVVPCHRVVGANGSLTGFAGGLAAKRFLLEHESRIDTEVFRSPAP